MTPLDRLKTYPIYLFENSQSPFVWSDVLLREINRSPDKIICHLWPLEKTVILGMPDKQIPYLADGLATITTKGYQPLVRNLGGLAVVADQGVLNLSLYLPNPKNHSLDITPAYQLMTDLLQTCINNQEIKLEAYEIPDSYCPGNYDLSIKGKKVAGLAQRRIKDAIVVSCYISISGDQTFRGQLIADFYRDGIKGQDTLFTYPKVNPSAMANLTDFCPTALSVSEFKNILLTKLAQLGQSLSTYQVTLENEEDFEELSQLTHNHPLTQIR